MRGSPEARQRTVEAHFEADAASWRMIYGQGDVRSRRIQRRLTLAMALVDHVHLDAGARVLEVGAGAGVLAARLAARGLTVEATDPVEAMRRLARATAREMGVAERVTVSDADVHALPFRDTSFDLVVALGVLPWIDRPDAAVREICRVLAPGGHAILSASNRLCLSVVLDPARHPALAPLRARVLAACHALARRRVAAPKAAPVQSFRRPTLDRLLIDSGLDVVTGIPYGWGPFTVLGRRVFADDVGMRLERRLDLLGARHRWLEDWFAEQYVVLARRR